MKFIEIENLLVWEGKYLKDGASRTAMLNADRILWFYKENDDVRIEQIHIRLVGCDYEDDIVVRYTDRLWSALLSLDDIQHKGENNEIDRS